MSKYSFSKLDLFKQCKRKYKYRYIDKLSGDLILPALVKRKRVHSLLEHFGTDYKPDFKATKLELQEVYDIFNRFIKSDLGKEILAPKSVREFHIKFDSDLKPTNLKPSLKDKSIALMSEILLNLLTSKLANLKNPKILINFQFMLLGFSRNIQNLNQSNFGTYMLSI